MASEETTVLWMSEETDIEGVNYIRADLMDMLYINIIYMQLIAIYKSITGDYDLIISFSLIPYGLISLITGNLSRTPSHLGIIGGDLDVHAKGKYGKAVHWLFRRFDIVTVAGSDYAERVLELGVSEKSVFCVTHPPEEQYFNISGEGNRDYDLLWLSRVSEEKDPLLFIEILHELDSRGLDFTAAFVGDGPLMKEVERSIQNLKLDDFVETTGWCASPIEYHRNSKIFVLTSKREMLPLTLIETMLVGTAPITPSLGGISDIVNHRQNGLIVETRAISEYADAIEKLLSDEEFRHRLASNAPNIESEVSHMAVANTWRDIFDSIES